MDELKSAGEFKFFGVKPMAPLLIVALASLLSLGTLGVWSKDAPSLVAPVNKLGVSAAQCLELSKLDPGRRIEAGDSLSSEWIEAGKLRPPGVVAGPMLSAHCRLSGKMSQRKGADDKSYHIGFELRLPVAWNGRFLFQGGGGNDGVVRPAVGPQASVDYALNKGFAVVTTDAGHQGSDASFGYDSLARIDHAYRSYDIVASKAKELIQRHYDQGAQKSYFVGCSGGGRQGMVFAQRFPEQFDGVLAMAPAMTVAKGATIAAAWDTQTLQSIAPKNAEGLTLLSQAFSNDDLGLLRKSVLQACDAQDGVVDGLVSNPAACRFTPLTLACPAGVSKDSTCLSAPQVQALEKIFKGARTSAGAPLYFPWPWDAGIGHPDNDWRMWKLGNSLTAIPNSRHVFLMQDAMKHEFVTPPDPSLSIFTFDFDRDPARMDAYAWIYNTEADVELKSFKARGGKLLLAHGMADPIFSANESVDYYQRMQARHGASTSDFARLFLIPGMGHCAGGAATDAWEGLDSLVAWVEKNQAPQGIVARGTKVFPGRTRPLCAWPSYSHYKGSGDIESAENFECRQ
jgi:pimeloyl-ACP methyl ester carboxylesterase